MTGRGCGWRGSCGSVRRRRCYAWQRMVRNVRCAVGASRAASAAAIVRVSLARRAVETILANRESSGIFGKETSQLRFAVEIILANRAFSDILGHRAAT